MNLLIESRLNNILEVSKDTIAVIDSLQKQGDDKLYYNAIKSFCHKVSNYLEKLLNKNF